MPLGCERFFHPGEAIFIEHRLEGFLGVVGAQRHATHKLLSAVEHDLIIGV